jgi:acyl-CoA thioester hydrolase
MPGKTIYRTTLRPEWVDNSGHLRRPYLSLVLSFASDSMMDYLGLDERYRARTGCTLYSLEMHLHWLRDVNADDTLEVDVHVLASDTKRLRVGFDVRPIQGSGVVATAEFLYLHVHRGETTHAAPFPSDIERAILDLKATSGPWPGPGSRPMAIENK